jgi:alkylation response protein AidB-like acyl-CoA dehydrogenase
MYLDRTAEQRDLAATTRELLAKQWTLADLDRRLAADALPAPLWSAITAAGWFDVLRPTAADGLGWSAVEAAAVSEEAGRALVPGPIVEAIALAAFTDLAPDSSTLAAPNQTDIRRTARGLTGVARFVPYADRCQYLVVGLPDGLYRVALDQAGIERSVGGGLDIVARPVTVQMQAAAATSLGSADATRGLIVLIESLLAARLLGMLDAALELAVAYVQTREQFGQPVGSFQAVQQLLADAKLHAVAARSACYASQAAIADGMPDAAVRTWAAKSYTTDAAQTVIEAAIQAHGGIGFTAEVPLHRYLKHTLTLRAAYGDPTELRRRLARALIS